MSNFFKAILLLAIGFAFFVEEASAQRWNRYRKEFAFSFGAANMLSDLGGGPGDGSRYGDFQLPNSSYALGVSWKYRIHNNMALRANVIYGQLIGDDNTTENLGRRNRNLDVKTNLIELSGQYEFYLIREKIGSRYKLDKVKGYGSSHFAWYIFAGIGGAYYNPKGSTADGEYVNLASLNTEGQGLEGAPKDYNQLTFVFPFGTGLKYNITHLIGVQFEMSMRLTTTDYLDDASTDYYDGAALEKAYGSVSKEMADKQYFSLSRHSEGGIRGHDDKMDTYMFGLLSLTYRWRSRAKSRVRL
ncbi:MAG: hypothetical protein ACJA2N_000426 [Salibacteraceae bacterium]|jgi:hypothetical protein